MLGDFGFRYGVSGKVAPSGPLAVDKGHWAAAALGHAWVFNQKNRVVDLVTGTKGKFMTAPTAANRVVTRWGPGYQTNVQGDSDFIATLQAAADCRQGNVAVAFGMSNYTPKAANYDGYLIRESISPWTYGSTDPAWVIEGDPSNLYWDNGNSGGANTNNDGGIFSGFTAGRDGLNIIIASDNGTAAGTVLYHNGKNRTGASSSTLIFGTNAASTDSIQIGNNYVPTSGVTTDACYHFVYIFKRALSTMEIQSLNSNPYQFWVPENITTRFQLVAGGNASTSLTGNAGTGAAGTFQKTVSLLLDFALSPALIGALASQDQETLSGVAATGSTGTLRSGTANLTGAAGTAAAGAFTPQVATAIPASSAASAPGSLFLGHGVTPPAAVGTGTLGALSWADALSLAGAAGPGSLGSLQAQGSIATYLLGASSAGAAGVFDLSAGTGVIPTGAAGTSAIGTAFAGLAPTTFGVGGTGRIGIFDLSGSIIADGSAQIQAAAAVGTAGDLHLDSQASAQLSGVAATATVGTPVAASPGVWVKPRSRAAFWTREY